ncbi:YkvI family membrane protein [Paeniglutamicibacter antarcticus]|uniref:Membrane protein YkvI n=1 Tax=Paeniglutamicibacter antarcticus TaxID=494023 RepID=A0ABP9THU3_9MICC
MALRTNTRAHLETTEKTSVLRVLTYAGAIIAFLIGSGFATGQEIMQYFTSYGYWGVFGTGLLVLVLMTYVAVEFFVVGQKKKFDRPSRIFHYYCGKHLGTFFDFFSILFVFLSFTVMVAGAGAVFEEHYGLSKYIGGVGLALAVAISVWFGLKNLVDVIGKIGPLIVVVAVALGILGILRNPGGIAEGNALLPSLELTQASTSWFMAGLSYVGFCMLWLAAFLTALGKTARSRKEAAAGGMLGAVAFSVACIIVGLGLLANIVRVGGTEIPMLVLAKDMSPVLAAGISVMVIAGIYTTAVPLLWTVSSRFFADKTLRFKYLTIALAAIGTLIGLILPFSKMVNIVYVVNGYVGILLLVMMLVKTGTRLARRQQI